MTDWVFSDNFQRLEPTANYVGIASLVCNVLLLLTYLVLPEEKSHRHYLSIGLTVSLILLSIAFVIPLGTKPDMCFDTLTPDNMYTDTGCAWTGALLLAGAMGAIVWSTLTFASFPTKGKCEDTLMDALFADLLQISSAPFYLDRFTHHVRLPTHRHLPMGLDRPWGWNPRPLPCR